MTVSHPLGDCFGVGSWLFVEKGGAGLRELALLRQGQGPVVSGVLLRVFLGGRWEGGRGEEGREGLWCLPEGSAGALEPLFAHSSHAVGGSFAVLFASSFTREDQFRRAEEVGPGPRVIVRSDAQQGGQNATSPGLSGCLWDVRSEWNPGGKDLVQVWLVGVLGSFQELEYGIVESRRTSGTARSGLGRNEVGADQAKKEGAVGQTLVWDLAFRKSRALQRGSE